MKAIVLLSGGIDSTVALASALWDGIDVGAISFDYGQTHRRELDAAEAVARHYGIEQRVIPLGSVLGSSSALTGGAEIPEGVAGCPDATVVPGRNLVMLSVAIAIAERSDSGLVIIGSNADDHAGYLDCRPRFLTAVDSVARLGTGDRVEVYAPLLGLTKRQVVELGRDLDAPLDLTWSCYRGGDVPCGRCGACLVRQEAIA